MELPRIMFAAPKSGSGKTLITCAFLDSLVEKNIATVAYKCGPDYIDPMFHRTVWGIESENLDTWFLGADDICRIISETAAKKEDCISVIEGVMGLYDGVGGINEEGSSYHLAYLTSTPIVLIADVRGMGRTMIAYIKGMIDYDKHHLIKGIILNRISESFYETMKPLIEAETGIPVVGFYPVRKDLVIESRHLGLILPNEIEKIKEKLNAAGLQFMKSVDFDAVMEIARGAVSISQDDFTINEISNSNNGDSRCRLAVARDEAFCFYYGENIKCLQRSGADIVYFSPVHDEHLPEDIDGILLGGGYPEIYAEKLSGNISMRNDILDAINQGMPSLAECGGFIYLHEEITDEAGNSHKLVGAVRGSVSYKGKLVRFGYVSLNANNPDEVILLGDESIKGHEFHYYDSDNNGMACKAFKPTGSRSWDCSHAKKDGSLWGFAHLYYPSMPKFTDRFVAAMRDYKDKR